MTRDDKRELLHDFVDWHPGLDNYDCDLADAFLAQHAADLTPAPAEVATSSRSGGEGQGPPTDLLIDIPAPSASGARETHEPANGGRIEVGSESITEQWREWYRQSGGEYWDKVVDIERELGRGPDELAVSVAADLTPTPVRVATSSHSGDERQSLQNMQQLPAPHVKVTEVVGLLDVDDGIFPDGSDPRPYGLVSCCPDEAEDKRGRFRITVEFWPQED